MTFSEFSLDPAIIEGIETLGFKDPTPIQIQAIPEILTGKDMIASAQTGTGKTAAFLLPVIHQIIHSDKSDVTQALIIVPTRELAMQIDQQLEGLSYFANISSIAIFGGGDGNSFTREKKALTSGADIIVGTPGRLIAHLNMGYVKMQHLKHLVLDEADRMLDMGFHDDIMRILSYLPQKRQNLLFSATMPNKIRNLAKKVLHEPVEINIAQSKPADRIKQEAYVIYDTQKHQLIEHLLKERDYKSIIVFCSTRNSVNDLTRHLSKKKFPVKAIHSDLEQSERKEVLGDFKNRKFSVLVATDILSRGIDVENIDIVINYDVPGDSEDYVHRIGRTARAEKEGGSITLINEKDQGKFAAIEKFLEGEVEKPAVPEALGETPEYKPRSGGGGGKGGKKPYYKKKKKPYKGKGDAKG